MIERWPVQNDVAVITIIILKSIRFRLIFTSYKFVSFILRYKTSRQ